jgi:fatty-acyl-CoA synthase
MISEDTKTLIQPIIERALHQPDHLVLEFIHENGNQERVTAGEFYSEACLFADALIKQGLQADDLVIVVLKHSRELLSAFWGSLLLGSIVSIFPYLTEKLDPQLYMERVKTLVANEGARAVITFPEFKDDLSNLLRDVDCRVISTDEVLGGFKKTGDGFIPSGEFQAGKIAFLQHSSGTTGLQKGVALSHGSVLNQIRSLSQALQFSATDRVISWLPLYHDMGLIGGFVLPIVAGIPLILLSPFHWVRDPKILFTYAAEHHATLTWLPNFAFNHCVRGIRRSDIQSLDLSSLRAMISCSEPVRRDSFELFLNRFQEHGIQSGMLQASYALAENTFAATQTVPGEPPYYDWIDINSLQKDKYAEPVAPESDGSFPMVSNGKPIPGTEVAIAGPDGKLLPESSNCLLTGYYLRPELTDQAMKDGWFHSGDIGYMADGNLYVSGRMKDMIIVGGKNVFPQDLEAIANIVPGVHPGRVVAFGVDDIKLGSEGVIMICEVEADHISDEEKNRIESEIRQRIVRETEVVLKELRLVDERWLIKTSSGKIARNDNREKYLKIFNN